MNEKKKALDKEQKEQRAIYIENKILSFLLPITGIVALIFRSHLWHCSINKT